MATLKQILLYMYNCTGHFSGIYFVVLQFDIAEDLCYKVDKRSKVFTAINHIVHSRWVLLKSTVYFYCILSVLSVYCLWRILFISSVPLWDTVYHLTKVDFLTLCILKMAIVLVLTKCGLVNEITETNLPQI